MPRVRRQNFHEAIEVVIRVRRRRALDRAMAVYAAELAGTPAELDLGLEAATIEHLLFQRDRR